MNDYAEAPPEQSGATLALPEEVMTTPDMVKTFIEEEFVKSRFNADLTRMRDPASDEHQALVALGKNGGTGYGISLNNWYLQQAGKARGEVPMLWLEGIISAKIPNFGPRDTIRAFDRRKFGSSEAFAETVTDAYEGLARNRVGIQLTRDMLDNRCRTVDEFLSTAATWMEYKVETNKTTWARVDQTSIGPNLFTSILESSRALSTLPDEERSSADIAAEAFLAMHRAAGERQELVGMQIRNLVTTKRNGNESPEMTQIFNKLAQEGIAKNWNPDSVARYKNIEVGGRTVREYDEEGLKLLIESLDDGSELNFLGKKPKKEVLIDEASAIVEDTLRGVAASSDYGATVLSAYSRMIANPWPGRFVAPSLPQLIGLSNQLVKQGMPGLPEAKRRELEPLEANIANLPEALTRMLYIIEPDIFDRTEEDDDRLKAGVALRVAAVNALIDKTLETETRQISVGDFVLQRTLQGVPSEAVAKELASLEEPGRDRPDDKATRHYRRTLVDTNTRKRAVYFNRRSSGNGVIS